jgi:hypothetical protein
VDQAGTCGVNPFSPNVELATGMNGQPCHVSNNALLLPNVDLAATMRRDTSRGRLGHKRRAKEVIEVDSDSDESSVYQAILRRRRSVILESNASPASPIIKPTTLSHARLTCFGDMPFDPLVDSCDDESGSALLDDDCSDDESLKGHDEGWLLASKRSRIESIAATSIDVMKDKTHLTFEDIPIIFRDSRRPLMLTGTLSSDVEWMPCL